MQPCTLEDTPVGTHVYNIFVAKQQKVEATFYDRYKVYFNPREADPQAPAKFLAIKVVDLVKHPEEEQLRVCDSVNLLMEQCLPETRLTAAGRYTWEIITNFVHWHEELEVYIPLYHWFTGPQVEITNGLVWNTGDRKYYLSQVFQDVGYPPGVCFDANSNTLVPDPDGQNPDPDPRNHRLNINSGLDPGLVPNGNQNQNPHCNPSPRRMGDDFKLTAISKLPKLDGETEGHKCPITFKIQTESAWEFINGLAKPQGGLMDDIHEAWGRAMVQQLSGDPLSWFESFKKNPGLRTADNWTSFWKAFVAEWDTSALEQRDVV